MSGSMGGLVASLPTGRRGQVLAVALTALAAALLWFGLLAPVADWYADRQSLLVQRRTLAARMASVAQTAPILQRQLAAATAEPRTALLDGATEAIAGAVLQQRLQDLSERAGVRLTSAEVLAAEPAGAYRRIRLRVSVSGRWARLVALLEAAEQSTPRMLIDDLQLGASRTITTDTVKPLDASFTAVALYGGPTR